ncbi:hypothetical protein EDF24_0835 [Curtobacterium sp. PhB130]|uniref:hypothetical protein n=1 Tax=Curtobacterium sp. PhB130 TaxID=2485178 RepID=UPI000F4B4B04|nr:hypothetical protein [Curtobacterium sp. PhB130]ROS78065.1 hypothetical protein EDF24_0835 [Curtobacterium sp. PhB130]
MRLRATTLLTAIAVASVTVASVSTWTGGPAHAADAAPGPRAVAATTVGTAAIQANPGNPAAPTATAHTVSANGTAVPVKAESVSGTSHDVAMFAKGTGTATVRVTMPGLAASATPVVTPRTLAIATTRSGDTVTFTIRDAHPLVIETPGVRALFLYVTQSDTDVPSAADPNVLYYGPGEHDAGVIRPTSGQTVYLAPGALVRGRIDGDGVTGVTVRGRGILDAGDDTSRTDKTMAIRFHDSSDITVEGIGVRNAQWWQTLYIHSSGIDVSWMNLMGTLINNDGIDTDGVQDMTVSHDFVMSGDDGFGWHALDAATNGEPETRGLHADDTTFWNVTGGNPVRFGSSMETEVFTDVSITRSYVLRAKEVALKLDVQDWATLSDVTVDGYHVESQPVGKQAIVMQVLKGPYSNDTGYRDERGHITGITIRDFTSVSADPVTLSGWDAAHGVSDVSFSGVVLGGVPLTAAQVRTNAFVSGVTVA